MPLAISPSSPPARVKVAAHLAELRDSTAASFLATYVAILEGSLSTLTCPRDRVRATEVLEAAREAFNDLALGGGADDPRLPARLDLPAHRALLGPGLVIRGRLRRPWILPE